MEKRKQKKDQEKNLKIFLSFPPFFNIHFFLSINYILCYVENAVKMHASSWINTPFHFQQTPIDTVALKRVTHMRIDRENSKI